MQRSTSDVASYRVDRPAVAGEACAIVFRRNSDFRALSRRYFFDCTHSPMKAEVSTLPASVVSPAHFSLGVLGAWLALCVIWSSTWLAIKIGLRDLPPISFVALRFIISAGVLAGICAGRFRFFPRPPADYAFLALTGL